MKKLSQFAVIAALVVGSIACTDRGDKHETATVAPEVVSTAPVETGTEATATVTETSATTETTETTATDATTSTQ